MDHDSNARRSMTNTNKGAELNSTPIESMTKALREHGSIVEIIRNGRVCDGLYTWTRMCR